MFPCGCVNPCISPLPTCFMHSLRTIAHSPPDTPASLSDHLFHLPVYAEGTEGRALRTAPRTREALGKHPQPPAHLLLTSRSPRSPWPPPCPPPPPTSLTHSVPLLFPALWGLALFYCQSVSWLHKGGLCYRSFQMLSIWKTFQSEGVCPLDALGKVQDRGSGVAIPGRRSWDSLRELGKS